MFGWILWTAASTQAGTLTATDQTGWSGGTVTNVSVGTELEIDNLVNETGGWYRRSWDELEKEAQAQKDDDTWFSNPDRCLRLQNNTTFGGPTRDLAGHQLRTGPKVIPLSNVDYLSAVPSGRLLTLPSGLKTQEVRLLISGSRIAQRDLTVRFHYTDSTISSVVVPIPVDTTVNAARNGAGAGWTRVGVAGLLSTANPNWDKDGMNGTDCAGNGADLVEVTSPFPLKTISSISFLYTSYDDAAANAGWLSGPLAVSLLDINYDALYTYRGTWASPPQVSQLLDAGSHAFFHRMSWNADLVGDSEIYIDLTCGTDTSGNGQLEATELEPVQSVLLSQQTSPWTLPVPCEGRYLSYEVELVDAFEDFPALFDVTFTFDPDADQDGFGALGAITAPDCDDNNASIFPGAPEIVGNNKDDDCNGTEICYVDADNDDARTNATVPSADADCDDSGEARATAALDCADNDPTRHPAATEIVGDDIDQNCNNHDLCYVDADRDTWGTQQTDEANAATCLTANSEAKRSGDCADNDANRFPENIEIVGDGIDQDCDAHDRCYVDSDGDMFGSTAEVTAAGALCVGQGESIVNTDCDDTLSSINPAATEIAGNDVDENCDARVDCYVDADDDGARTEATAQTVQGDLDCQDPFEGRTTDPLDCLDTDAAVFPGAAELAGDGVDQNCDGIEDCLIDGDNDGGRTEVVDPGGANDDGDCDDPGEAYASEPLDCDDADPTRSPIATELVGDGIDTNCDNTELCYVDADDDGARLEDTLQTAPGDLDCDDAFEALPIDPLDCDDTNAQIRPGAEELCNAADDDCNGTIDDGSGPLVLWHPDVDGDGFGDPAVSAEGACGPDETWTEDASDCDDLDSLVSPDGVEICNGIDDDCNEDIDDASPAVTWYVDSDGDGFGSPEGAVDAGCPPDPSFVADPTDCDDTDAAIHPGAEEVCNGLDDDCAAGIDDLGDPVTWFRDADGDGLGTDSETVEADCNPGEGWAEIGGDCDDSDAKLAETCLSGSGCGCDQTSAGSSTLALLAGLGLFLRRRR